MSEHGLRVRKGNGGGIDIGGGIKDLKLKNKTILYKRKPADLALKNLISVKFKSRFVMDKSMSGTGLMNEHLVCYSCVFGAGMD